MLVCEPNFPKWRCTFVYGEPRGQDMHHMWKLLSEIAPKAKEPWMMVGDFNETMWQHEHFSHAKRSERNMANFRDLLAWCNLHDLGYFGPDWTYNNKQEGARNVKARLDRAVETTDWSELFPD